MGWVKEVEEDVLGQLRRDLVWAVGDQMSLKDGQLLLLLHDEQQPVPDPLYPRRHIIRKAVEADLHSLLGNQGPITWWYGGQQPAPGRWRKFMDIISGYKTYILSAALIVNEVTAILDIDLPAELKGAVSLLLAGALLANRWRDKRNANASG